MLIPVCIILIVILLYWIKRKEGLTQSCTDQDHLQKTCDTKKPVPYCASNPKSELPQDRENSIECIPLPKDGKCPTDFPNGLCPEWFDTRNGSCLTNAEFMSKTGIR